MISQYLTPEVTAVILTAVIIPFLKQLVSLFTTLIASKIDLMQHSIHSERLNHYIDLAEDAVFTAVDSVTQTYVQSLKNAGSFDEAAQKEAFEQAKVKALGMLGDSAKSALTESYGDLDNWMSNKIENYVKNGKTAI